MSGWSVVGIDPAPTKPAIAYQDGGWTQIKPTALRRFIAEIAEGPTPTLIAWDAPLSYDRGDFYDRRVDKVARAWIKQHVSLGHLRTRRSTPGRSPVCRTGRSPVTRSGCRSARRLPACSWLHEAPADGQHLVVIEVHPAVALGAWWIEAGCSEPLPRYKGKPEACRRIAEALSFPPGCSAGDDALDAFIAYRLGELLLGRGACSVGSSQAGGYVMPRCSATDQLLVALAAPEEQ
jgi:hypothetical protein